MSEFAVSLAAKYVKQGVNSVRRNGNTFSVSAEAWTTQTTKDAIRREIENAGGTATFSVSHQTSRDKKTK